jgi:hypothetical protein
MRELPVCVASPDPQALPRWAGLGSSHRIPHTHPSSINCRGGARARPTGPQRIGLRKLWLRSIPEEVRCNAPAALASHRSGIRTSVARSMSKLHGCAGNDQATATRKKKPEGAPERSGGRAAASRCGLRGKNRVSESGPGFAVGKRGIPLPRQTTDQAMRQGCAGIRT